jgi:SAM-dependent methyltransferase
MSDLTNSTYLRNKQYQDSRNLAPRAALHEQFSTNQTGWHPWVFQQIQLKRGSRVLEIGCGPGYLWQKNIHKLTNNWQIFLADLSRGMLEEARASLGGNTSFRYIILNGECLPFPGEFFDAVIANHVLFHLPELSKPLHEIQRVLKPHCYLYAATNGENHLQEIHAWKEIYLPGKDDLDWGTPARGFNLTNGAAILEDFFHSVHLLCFPDQLEITRSEPILQYIKSYMDENLPELAADRLRRDLEKQISEEGSIIVRKETGMFLAKKN